VSPQRPDAAPAGCPPWCTRELRTHTETWLSHASEPVRAGRAYALLIGHVHGESMETRLMVSHNAAAGHLSIPPGDADSLAALMAALGHNGLAAAIRKAAAQAESEAGS
jgi:hypothetical protein